MNLRITKQLNNISTMCDSHLFLYFDLFNNIFIFLHYNCQLPLFCGVFCNCLIFSLSLSQGMAECVLCPRGYSCPNPASPITACSEGTFSLLGQTTCTDCPLGHMCPSTMQNSVRCPRGTTTNGATKATNCTACPAGSFCPTPE